MDVQTNMRAHTHTHTHTHARTHTHTHTHTHTRTYQNHERAETTRNRPKRAGTRRKDSNKMQNNPKQPEISKLDKSRPFY